MNKADMTQADVNQGGNEQLSAGIDGELSKEAMRFLLRRLDHDTTLQQSWTHYNLARDGLRRQLPMMASATFASRVMLAIEQEAAPVSTKRNHWLRWSAGGAIAASVAAAALMIGQPTGDVDRTATLAGQRANSAVADVSADATPINKSAVPATVPAWLSGNSAGMLSQQASATSDAFPGENQPVYGSKRLSAYPLMHRYRTLNNNDGSYLLLLDPQQQPVSVSRNPSRQAAAAVH
jgi:sigma-E factor negative regulatory protein RseA